MVIVLGLTVNIIGNGRGDTSSKPGQGCLCSTFVLITLGKA